MIEILRERRDKAKAKDLDPGVFSVQDEARGEALEKDLFSG